MSWEIAHRPRADHQVDVIGHQRPCEAEKAQLEDQLREPAEEVLPVRVIEEDRESVDAPHHHVVRSARRVVTRPSSHGGIRGTRPAETTATIAADCRSSVLTF